MRHSRLTCVLDMSCALVEGFVAWELMFGSRLTRVEKEESWRERRETVTARFSRLQRSW